MMIENNLFQDYLNYAVLSSCTSSDVMVTLSLMGVFTCKFDQKVNSMTERIRGGSKEMNQMWRKSKRYNGHSRPDIGHPKLPEGITWVLINFPAFFWEMNIDGFTDDKKFEWQEELMKMIHSHIKYFIVSHEESLNEQQKFVIMALTVRFEDYLDDSRVCSYVPGRDILEVVHLMKMDVQRIVRCDHFSFHGCLPDSHFEKFQKKEVNSS